MTGPVLFDTAGAGGSSTDGAKAKTTAFGYVLTGLSAISGLLFGYDTGVVSGAMILVKSTMHLSTIWHEIIVSGTILAAWIFSLTAGYSADRFGRKKTIMFAAVVFTLGSLVMGAAVEKYMLLAGRIIVGMAVGLASMSTPVYIAESAAPHLRGVLVTVYTLGVTFGQFVAGVVCGLFSEVHDGWRYMLGLAALPAAILFLGFIFMPESPRWLVSNGRYEEAEEVIQRLRGKEANVSEEVKSIREACEQQNKQSQTQTGSNTLMQILRTPYTRRALILGCVLQAFQQLAGINTVMYYSASIIQMAGVGDHSMVIWLSAGVAGVNFVCTFIGMVLVERIGRRPLALGSLAGVVVALLTLGLGFMMMATDAPDVTLPTGLDKCKVTSCTDCMSPSAMCGFCMVDLPNSTVMTCWPRNEDNELPLQGPCLDPAKDVTATWAVGWCPSDYSWIAVASLVLYLIFFAPGMGPLPWIINAEVHPLWARGFCSSIATSVNWLLNLAVSMTFLSTVHLLSAPGAFFLYSGVAFVGLVLLWWLLPETRGVSLEDMESLFVKTKPEDTNKTSVGPGESSSHKQ